MNLFLKTLIAISFLSFTLIQQTEFKKEGVSFKFPDDWKITDVDSLDGAGYYIAVEKSGLGESGIMSFTWLKNDIETEKFISISQESMKNNVVYKNSNLKFGKNYETTFGKVKALACNFTFKTFKIKEEGTIYCFKSNGKVFSIFRQEALEDKAKNKEGFYFIESTFTSN